MKLVILSEGDSAGSGSRISSAINKHSKDVQSTCIVNRSKRKIGHFNPDYIISEMEDRMIFLQEIINEADVIHFKDDEPLSREWNGLIIAPDKPIVHTAGGSSFRGHEFILENKECIASREVLFDKNWKTQKRLNGRYIHANGKEIQIDGMNFNSTNHNNIWSKRMAIPKKINSLAIKGKQRLIERKEDKNYDIRALIIRFFDSEGKVIETRKKNVGSIKSLWTDFEALFPVPKNALSMRFSFFNHRIYQLNYSISECVIDFYSLSDDKLVSLNSQTSVSNSTWDLRAYNIADFKTVLTPDLLARDETRTITPHVQPEIRIRKKRNKNMGEIIITHAPSNTGKKGTNEFIIPAINELSKKYNIKFNLIQNLSHEECLQEISKSDIFIDQMVAGYYGNAGLEAMTMGIPVLAYINDRTIKLAGGEWSKIPILRVNRLSIKSIINTLEPYLKDKKKLIKAGNLSKEWVKRIHSPKKVASMWEKIYKRIIKNNKINIEKISKNHFMGLQNDYSERLFRGGGSWREVNNVGPDGWEFSVDVENLENNKERINIYIDSKLKKSKEIKLIFFRIGWYGGKGARLIHSESILMEKLVVESHGLLKYVIYPDGRWAPGCYRLILEDGKSYKQKTHFFIDNYQNGVYTNLLVYPHIGSSIWNKKNNQFLEGFYSKKIENHKVESIDISEDEEGNEIKFIEWLFPAITWLERNKIPFRLIKDVDVKKDLKNLENIKTIIFVGDNHIWTQEVHNMVKKHLGKNIGDLVIFGSGAGEEIAYLTKDKKEALISLNFNSENNIDKWSQNDLPIYISSKIPRKRVFEEGGRLEGARAGIEIESIVDGYYNNIKFSEKLLSIDGEEFGEISSRIFHLPNGCKVFNGGMMNFPKYLPEINNNSEIKGFNEIFQVLKSMIWSEGKIYSDEEIVLDKFNKNWSEEEINFENREIPKICLVMPIWKRPNLTEKVMQYYQTMKLELEGEIELINISVGSEGKLSKKMSEKYDFNYIEHENFPLSKKWDRGIKESKIYDPDAVLIIGSDDIIETALIRSLLRKLNDGRLIVGIMDLYIYDSDNKKLNYWNGYGKDNHRYGETIGLCRLISNNLLKKMNYSIWGGLEISKGLDLAMTNRFMEFGIFPKHHLEETLVKIGSKIIPISHAGYFLEEIDGIAVDIKGKLNITPLGSYELKHKEKPELISKLNIIIGD